MARDVLKYSPRPDQTGDAIKVAVGVAFVVLVSPLRDVWAQAAWPWWTPFLAWGFVIMLAFWATGRGNDGH